ncbi:MAG: Coq4 family protein [Cyanobacteria bacterium P01_G01_bin.38]
MRDRVHFLKKAIQSSRHGQLGDVAAYKSALLGTRAYPDIAKKLAQLSNCFPKIDLSELRKLPEGTFGQVYAQHMDDCQLTPLEISPDVVEQFRHRPLYSGPQKLDR